MARWVLSAFLGYSQGRTSHHWEVAYIERPITPSEARQILGSYAKVRFLHRSRLASQRAPTQ